MAHDGQLLDEVGGLPFDAGQQQAIFGYGLTNENFLRQVKDQLPAKWFQDPYVSQGWKMLLKWYETYGFPRSAEEFETNEDMKGMSQPERVRMKKVMEVCRAKCGTYGLAYLSQQLTDWKRFQIFHRDLPQVANLLNARPHARLKEAVQLYGNSAREIQNTQFNGVPPADWTKWKQLLAELDRDVSTALTTGLSVLDRHLLPEGNGRGSLLRGDTTLIVAPTNAGKTSAMISIGIHNVRAGKDVLFISREGRSSDLQQKFLQSMIRKTRQELRTFSSTPEGEKLMDQLTLRMSERLDYLHMPQVNMNVEDAVGTVLSMQNARKAKYGKGYDMLVVDYPGIFQAALAREARWEYRQIQDYIYRQFVQLGLEEGFHVLAAAQTNREGSKINRGHGAKRLLSVEDISEAFGICMSATNVLTLNRSLRAQNENRLTFYIVKSRSSETGWAVTCRSDYARCLTHGDELGATATRGEGSNDDVIDSLLKQYPNRDIPAGYLIRKSLEIGEAKV